MLRLLDQGDLVLVLALSGLRCLCRPYRALVREAIENAADQRGISQDLIYASN